MIDRESIIENLLGGNGKIVTGPFYIYGRQNNREIEPWPYDPEKSLYDLRVSSGYLLGFMAQQRALRSARSMVEGGGACDRF